MKKTSYRIEVKRNYKEIGQTMTSEVVYIRGTVTQDKRGKRRRGGLISFQAAHNQTGLLQVIKPPPKKRDTKKVGRASLINSRGPLVSCPTRLSEKYSIPMC